jgi:hypothetical protein
MQHLPQTHYIMATLLIVSALGPAELNLAFHWGRSAITTKHVISSLSIVWQAHLECHNALAAKYLLSAPYIPQMLADDTTEGKFLF